MKDMSNRDKMILIIITIIIILVAGFFALIRPQYDKYVASTEAYETTKAEYDGIQQKLDAIPGLKDAITSIYEDSKKTAEIFVNDAFKTVNDTYSDSSLNFEIDQYLQPTLDESNLIVNNMGYSGLTNKVLTYYYYKPNVVTYSLLEAADINSNAERGKKGTFEADIEDLLLTDTILSTKESVEVQTNTVTLDVTGRKENLMTFLSAVKDDKNAILVESINIQDYQFTGGLDEEAPAPVVTAPEPTEPQVDEEGNPIEAEPQPEPTPTPTPSAGSTVAAGEGTSQMTLSVTFYNAKAIDKPDFGD